MHLITHENQIGELLASRRKTLKLSQTTVATRIALSQNRLSELESRPGTVTVSQLLALLSVLELELQIGARATGKRKSEP